jgi:hypothetical protein
MAEMLDMCLRAMLIALSALSVAVAALVKTIRVDHHGTRADRSRRGAGGAE